MSRARPSPWLLVAAAATWLAMASVTAPEPRAAAAAPSLTRPVMSPVGSPTAIWAAAPPPARASPPITMAFGGDVHFESHVAALLRRPGSGLASLRPYLATADLAMVNLETAITIRGTPAPKEFRFRTPATALTALAAAGVDVVTMANNHAVDYGPVGLRDTLAVRRNSRVRVVGIGANAAEAYAPAIFEVRGRRVAVLGASQIGDWTLQNWAATTGRAGIASVRPVNRLVSAVKAARKRADVVVVYLHWGVERAPCPDGAQRDAARQLARAGADVVVGAHPHVTQGAGWMGSTYVDYSLGNFVWYNRGSEATLSTGVLKLTLDGRRVTSARWTPLRVSASGLPVAPSAAVAARMQRGWQQSRRCTGLSRAPA